MRENVKILFYMIHPMGNNKQQVIADGNPYLRIDRVLRCTEERFDMQMLLYPFKEKLNLPTFSVKFCDGYCFKIEVIRNESINVIGVKVFIDNHSHSVRIILHNNRICKTYGIVSYKTCMFVNFSFFNNFKFHVVLCPCHEECTFQLEVIVKSPIVNITFVHKVIRAWFNRQNIKGIHVIDLTFGKPNERGDRTSQVEQTMHLKGSFIMMKFCPRTKFKTDFNGTAVESIDHIINTKTKIVIPIQCLCSFNEKHGKISINHPWFLFVELSESRLGYQLQTRMIQLRRKSFKGRLDYPKARPVSKLSKAHNPKLILAGELLGFKIAVVLVNDFLEFIIGNERHKLSEDGLSHKNNVFLYYDSIIQSYGIFIEKFTNHHNSLLYN